ncbi:dTMP kinase [Candidatus Pacearchaeota archaeon]|nr:dTMP kinase [Candidatus Pacearchaeota archaeon]
MAEKRGRFIVFEGIDGCGKTTQIKGFADYLFNRNKYNHVVLTREPYENATIRAILTQDKNPLAKADLLTKLFVDDRKKHARELIIPSLERGCYVVSDRYKLSTVAYQSAQGLDMLELLTMHDNLPVPDLTYIFDVPLKIVFERMGLDKGRTEHKFEASRKFLEKVRQNYLKLSQILSYERIAVIYGNRTPDKIFEDVKGIFEELNPYYSS